MTLEDVITFYEDKNIPKEVIAAFRKMNIKRNLNINLHQRILSLSPTETSSKTNVQTKQKIQCVYETVNLLSLSAVNNATSSSLQCIGNQRTNAQGFNLKPREGVGMHGRQS